MSDANREPTPFVKFFYEAAVPVMGGYLIEPAAFAELGRLAVAELAQPVGEIAKPKPFLRPAKEKAGEFWRGCVENGAESIRAQSEAYRDKTLAVEAQGGYSVPFELVPALMNAKKSGGVLHGPRVTIPLGIEPVQEPSVGHLKLADGSTVPFEDVFGKESKKVADSLSVKPEPSWRDKPPLF